MTDLNSKLPSATNPASATGQSLTSGMSPALNGLPPKTTEYTKPNLYWNVFLGLEKELLILAEYVHVEDAQLNVYSTKIADLLVRTSVEIESIAKALFDANGGTIPSGQQCPYFDTDCLKHLNTIWDIESKHVSIVSPFLYMSETHRDRTPLQKCSQRGKGKWKKAYQAVKHDRQKSLSKGNIDNFIEALAALYILNLYYRNQVVDLASKSDVGGLDLSFGSSVFSVQCHKFPGIGVEGLSQRGEEARACIYLLQSTTDTTADVADFFKKLADETGARIRKELMNGGGDAQQLSSKLMVAVAREHYQELHAVLGRLRYEAVLNKSSRPTV